VIIYSNKTKLISAELQFNILFKRNKMHKDTALSTTRRGVKIYDINHLNHHNIEIIIIRFDNNRLMI